MEDTSIHIIVREFKLITMETLSEVSVNMSVGLGSGEEKHTCTSALPSYPSPHTPTSTVILCLITVFLSTVILGMSSCSKNARNRRGPASLPYLGHLHLLAWKPNHSHLTLRDLGLRYGELFDFQLGCKQTVVLSSYEMIRETFSRIVDRPAWFLVRKTTQNCKGLVWQSGEDWRALRRFSHRGLKAVSVSEMSLEERVQEEVGYMVEELMSCSTDPLNPASLLQRATSNITCALCFGNRFEYSDSRFCLLMDMIRKIFTEFSISEPINFFSILEHLPYSSRVRNSFTYMAAIDGLINEEISRHRQTFDPDYLRDFVDLYLQEEAQQFNGDDEAFTDENIRLIIRDLFIAGSETTATTLQWLLLYMARFPDVQDRCYHEIYQVLGSPESPPPYSVKQFLPYTEATILEVQRLASVVPFLLHQNNNSAKTFRGETISRDSALLGNVYAVHTSDALWENAESFRPQRFLDAEGAVCRNKKAFMPFGIGPRRCPGEFLARMELFMFFIGVLHRFEIRVQDESRPPSLIGVTGVTLAPEEHQLRFIPRTQQQ